MNINRLLVIAALVAAILSLFVAGPLLVIAVVLLAVASLI